MIFLTVLLLSCAVFAQEVTTEPLWYEGETHLKNVRQLTFGGENAEAYFNVEGTELIFQSTRDDYQCDQIFTMDLNGENIKLVSTGKGATTCSFYIPGTDEVIWCSTHDHAPECPPKPDRALGYVWGLSEFDVYRSKADGSELRRLTDTPGYDAEAAVSPDGKEIVWTSGRDGDLELYKMNIDGSNVQRLTWTVGYDGGPFFSPDGKHIIYRAFHPASPYELAQWNHLWEVQAVSPVTLDLWIMDIDGGNQRQITQLGSASFCPYVHPSGEWTIFTTNYADSNAHGMPNFDLFRVRPDGSDLERLTFSPTFDGFPMWSYDGKYLVWCGNRGERRARGETNVFIAEWVE